MANDTLDDRFTRGYIEAIGNHLKKLQEKGLLFQLRAFKKSKDQLASAAILDTRFYESKMSGLQKQLQDAHDFELDTGAGVKINKVKMIKTGYKVAETASSAVPAVPILGPALKLAIGGSQQLEKFALANLSVNDIPELINHHLDPCSCGQDERKSDLTKCDAAIEWMHTRRFTDGAVTYGAASLSLALMIAAPPIGLATAPALAAVTGTRSLYRKVREELKKKYDGRPTYFGGQKYVMAKHYQPLGEGLPANKQKVYLVTSWDSSGKEELFLSPGPDAVWQSDNSATECSAEGCSVKLTAGTLYGSNRHHCRVCGELFCDDCSSAQLPVLDSLSTYSPVFFGKAKGRNMARGEVTVTIDATHTRGRHAFIYEKQRVCVNCFALACQFEAKRHLYINGPMRRAEHLIEASIPKTSTGPVCLKALATIFTINRGNRRNTLLTVLAVDGAKTLVKDAGLKS
ncbi:MAG: FYVE zinc finger domain-containing protein [Arenicellales bacterium]